MPFQYWNVLLGFFPFKCYKIFSWNKKHILKKIHIKVKEFVFFSDKSNISAELTHLDKIFSHSFITYKAINSFVYLAFIANIQCVTYHHWPC